jgi:hypothetical protein
MQNGRINKQDPEVWNKSRTSKNLYEQYIKQETSESALAA